VHASRNSLHRQPMSEDICLVSDLCVEKPCAKPTKPIMSLSLKAHRYLQRIGHELVEAWTEARSGNVSSQLRIRKFARRHTVRSVLVSECAKVVPTQARTPRGVVPLPHITRRAAITR
jgi:hypothetical protein